MKTNAVVFATVFGLCGFAGAGFAETALPPATAAATNATRMVKGSRRLHLPRPVKRVAQVSYSNEIDAACADLPAESAKKLRAFLADAWVEGCGAKARDLLAFVCDGGLTRVGETPEKPSVSDAMRAILDLDRPKMTLAVARELSVSKSVPERRAAIEAFGWLGAPAITDLTAMLGDKNGFIAEDAFDAWGRAFSEVEGDNLRCEIVRQVVRIVEKPDHLDSMLLELSSVRADKGMETMDAIVCDAKATANAKKAAAEMFEHFGGEEYTTHEAALEVIRRWRNENVSDCSMTNAAEIIRQNVEEIQKRGVTVELDDIGKPGTDRK